MHHLVLEQSGFPNSVAEHRGPQVLLLVLIVEAPLLSSLPSSTLQTEGQQFAPCWSPQQLFSSWVTSMVSYTEKKCES